MKENNSEVLAADWAIQEFLEIRQAASEYLDPREGLEETHSEVLADWAIPEILQASAENPDPPKRLVENHSEVLAD